MASFSGTGSGQSCYKLVLNVTQSTQSITDNNTVVNWNIQIVNSSSSYSFSLYTSTIKAVINGVTVYSNTSQRSVGKSATVTIASGTLTIPHNADGTKTIACSCSYSESWPDSYTAGDMSCSGSLTLTTIPRASSISSISGDTIGSTMTINISRASSSFTHNVYYAFGSIGSTLINSNVITSCSFTVPMTFCNQIPNATSGTGTITVDTYNGSTKVGSVSTSFTVNVPNSVVPTLSNFTLTGNNLFNTYLLSNISTVTANITGASGTYGSTISSYKISGQGLSVTASSGTSTVLPASTFKYTATVTDSRGRTASKTASVTVLNYSKPDLSALIVRGVYDLVNDTFTVDEAEGTTLRIIPTYSYTSLSGNSLSSKTASGNNLNVTLGNSEEAVYLGKPTSSGAVGKFSTDNSFVITVKVTDLVGYTTTITVNVPTGITVLDVYKDGKGLAIGKVAEKSDTLDIAYKNLVLNGQSIFGLIYPIGAIYMSVNSTSPATLFGGTWVAWGSGRVPVGVNTSNTDFSTVEQTGGASTHTLTEVQLPVVSKTKDVHRAGGDFSNGTTSLKAIGGSAVATTYGTTDLPSFGGGQAHNNLQPYITCYMWKRTA